MGAPPVVTALPPRGGPAPEDELIWSLRRTPDDDGADAHASYTDTYHDARVATCVLRPHPLGIDLRASVGRETMYTKVHRTRERALGEADSLKKRLEMRGWQQHP